MSVRFIVALAFLNMTSVRAGRVVLTLYAIRLGAPPAAIGMLAATFSVIPVLFSWAGGRWADRFGARWLLFLGVGGSASGMLLPYFAPGLPAVFVAGLASGLSLTFCNVSLQNLVGVLSTPQDRARNFSNYSLAGSLSGFIGPLIAGFTIEHAGYGPACLVVFALAGIPLALLVVGGGGLPRGTGAAAPAGGPWRALALPGVWRVLAVSGIAQTASDLFQFYMPVYAHAAGLTPSAIGIVLAGYAAAQFVVRGAVPALVARSRPERVLAGAFLLGAAGIALVPFVHGAALLTVIAFLIGLGLGCTTPITMTLMFTRSPRGRSGEAMGLRLTADNLARLVGPVLFGMLASAAGLAVVFWLNAALLASGSRLARRHEPGVATGGS